MSDPTKTQQWKQCPKCGQHAYLNARVCAGCGREFKTQFNAQGKPVEVAPPTQQGFRYPEHPQQPVPYQPPVQYPPQQVYQQPPYQQPAPYQQPTQVKTTDMCALLAFACGVVGNWLLPILLGPAAFILGFVSLHRIRENPQLKGKGLAVCAMILGGIEVVTLSAFIRSLF